MLRYRFGCLFSMTLQFGDGSAGPVTAAAADAAPVPVALLYNVTWLPNTTEARAKLPADDEFPLLTATLQTGRRLNSATFRLNVSTFRGIGGAFAGRAGHV